MLNNQYGSFVPETNLDNLYSSVIPHSGHTLADALKDLVDNSFDAGAKNITIMIDGSKSIDSYLIIDDGLGMDVETLRGALTYSAGSIHNPGDLGKFSIGGTTACCTLGLSRRVYTKRKDGLLLIGEQDFRNVTTGTKIRQPTSTEEIYFKEFVGNHGTIVEIYDLREDKKEYKSFGALKNALAKDFGKTFYRLLNERVSLTISTPKEDCKVYPVDPLFTSTDPEKVKFSDEFKVDFKDHALFVRISEIDLEKLPSKSRGYDSQGIYFLRNNRLIMSGVEVKDLWKKNPRKNAGRVEISFTEEMDAHFGLTATKNKINLSQSLKDTLSDKIKEFVHRIERKWEKSTDVSSDEINEENQNFVNKLVHNTGMIHLPSSQVSSGEKISRSKNKNGEKGTVIPKGTGITRSGKKVITPEFIFENQTRIPDAFWTEFPENGGMKIIVNLSHSFVREHWTNGDEAQRLLMRKWMTATCLAQFRKKETSHERAADSFMRDMFDELFNIQEAFK